eukprot:5695240-Prymnesium_polylepis.1
MAARARGVSADPPSGVQSCTWLRWFVWLGLARLRVRIEELAWPARASPSAAPRVLCADCIVHTGRDTCHMCMHRILRASRHVVYQCSPEPVLTVYSY